MDMLIGRDAERASLDRLLSQGRAGQSEVAVLRGAAGAGKTALLNYAATRADGYRIVRATGVESEMELPFAGLHQLCAPLSHHVAALPAPQRGALETAFGLSTGARPERFLVGLAVLSLLSEAGEEHAVLCLVDDAQWLDRSSAQVLAFVARRLHAESVVLLCTVREASEHDLLVGLPELRVSGLSDPSARELLNSVIGAPLDERVRERILAEAHGNPLALLELPRGLSPAGTAGGFSLPTTLPLQNRIEASFARRVQKLAPATQRLLVLVAAEPTGEPCWCSARLKFRKHPSSAERDGGGRVPPASLPPCRACGAAWKRGSEGPSPLPGWSPKARQARARSCFCKRFQRGSGRAPRARRQAWDRGRRSSLESSRLVRWVRKQRSAAAHAVASCRPRSTGHVLGTAVRSGLHLGAQAIAERLRVGQ